MAKAADSNRFCILERQTKHAARLPPASPVSEKKPTTELPGRRPACLSRASPRAAATTRTSSCSHDTSRRFGEGGREGREAEISRSCRRGGVDCRHDSRGWRRSAAGAESRSVTGVEEPDTVARREQQAAGLRISRVAGVQEPNAVARRVDFDGGRISRGRRRGGAARCRTVRSSPLPSSPCSGCDKEPSAAAAFTKLDGGGAVGDGHLLPGADPPKKSNPSHLVVAMVVAGRTAARPFPGEG